MIFMYHSMSLCKNRKQILVRKLTLYANSTYKKDKRKLLGLKTEKSI